MNSENTGDEFFALLKSIDIRIAMDQNPTIWNHETSSRHFMLLNILTYRPMATLVYEADQPSQHHSS